MVFRILLFILFMKEDLYTHASGYDAYSSCYRKSRKKQDLPCDFEKQTWCSIPGNSYPWHAVRRFVFENQGLMRRMYGDERHLSVLRAEIENNDVDSFDDYMFHEEFRKRYSKDIDGTKGFLRLFAQKDRKKPGRTFNEARKTKSEKTKKSIDEKSSNILYQNHFKNSIEIEKRIPPPNLAVNESFIKPLTTSANPIRSSEITFKPESVTLENDMSRFNLTATPNETTPPQFTTTMMDITTQPDKSVDWNFNLTDGFITQPYESEIEEAVDYSMEDDLTTTTVSDTLTTTNEIDFQEEIPADKDYQDVTEDEEEEEEDEEGESIDEQETADEAIPHQQSPPLIRLKGINACPVKEEVVAPFWANNTRGEVLALLNLYPFEQYVHWEKCTFEHKQMFCREGCRCEQQYRLHRLLAYDPNNECRGIFSDWFRFPSCCVCKCYDIPMEFRLTSRSPRSNDVNYNREKVFRRDNREQIP